MCFFPCSHPCIYIPTPHTPRALHTYTACICHKWNYTATHLLHFTICLGIPCKDFQWLFNQLYAGCTLYNQWCGAQTHARPPEVASHHRPASCRLEDLEWTASSPPVPQSLRLYDGDSKALTRWPWRIQWVHLCKVLRKAQTQRRPCIKSIGHRSQ